MENHKDGCSIIIGFFVGIIICALLGSCKSKANAVSIKTDSVFHNISLKTDNTAIFSNWLRNYIDTSTTWEFAETITYDTNKADSNGISPVSKKETKITKTKRGKSSNESLVKSEETKKSDSSIIDNSVSKAVDSTKKEVTPIPSSHKRNKWKYFWIGIIIGVLSTLVFIYRKKIIDIWQK